MAMTLEATPNDAGRCIRTSQTTRTAEAFYVQVLQDLLESDIAFLVAGGYAVSTYTGGNRVTKDLDLFTTAGLFPSLLSFLKQKGYAVAIEDERWIGKILFKDHFVDVIFGSANGMVPVQEDWFEHAHKREVLGIKVQMLSPTDLIWSKAFIRDRQRYDGADLEQLGLPHLHRSDLQPHLVAGEDRGAHLARADPEGHLSGPGPLGEPAGGVQLQGGDAFRRRSRVAQLRRQEFPEERVVAIPGTVVVDALEKQVVALGRGDAFTAVADAQCRVAHRGREGVETVERSHQCRAKMLLPLRPKAMVANGCAGPCSMPGDPTGMPGTARPRAGRPSTHSSAPT